MFLSITCTNILLQFNACIQSRAGSERLCTESGSRHNHCLLQQGTLVQITSYVYRICVMSYSAKRKGRGLIGGVLGVCLFEKTSSDALTSFKFQCIYFSQCSMSKPQVSEVDLSKPRYGDKTYGARFRHFLETTSPLNAFASNRRLAEASALVKAHKYVK